MQLRGSKKQRGNTMTRQSDAKHVTLEINGGSQDTNAKKSTEKKTQRQALLQDEIVSTFLSKKK